MWWSREKVIEKAVEVPEKVTPPEAPKPLIGCVSQSILDDLKPESFADWVIEYKVGLGSYFEAKKNGKNYVLWFWLKDWAYSSFAKEGAYLPSICGMQEFAFSQDEKAELCFAFDKIKDYSYNLLKEKNKEKDRRKLAELFPQCYETNTNI